MRRNWNIVAGLMSITAVLCMCTLAGCGTEASDMELKGVAVEYTVVEDDDLPEKLKSLIDERKGKEFRLTYTTNEYMYMVTGYGTMETDGYSIAVRGVTVDDETVYVGTTLIGPRENEKVNSSETTPYIVLKCEKRGDTVVYR